MALWSRKTVPEPAQGWGRALDLEPDPVVPSPATGAVVPPGAGWTARTTDGVGVAVWTRAVPDPDDAARQWRERVALHPGTGLWPVLVGEAFWEAVELEAALETPVPDSAAAWLHAVLTDATYDAALVESVARGPAPSPTTPGLGAGGLSDLTELVLVPAAADWLVPQVLAWDGAVNQDVLGEVHALVLRRWSARHGTRLLGLTRDEVVLDVTRPPATADAALEAALEAYAYCQDAVDQGAGTLDRLTVMMRSPTWRFWWD